MKLRRCSIKCNTVSPSQALQGETTYQVRSFAFVQQGSCDACSRPAKFVNKNRPECSDRKVDSPHWIHLLTFDHYVLMKCYSLSVWSHTGERVRVWVRNGCFSPKRWLLYGV